MSEVGNHDTLGAGKHSNPKDIIGSKKLPIGLVPDTIVSFAALAFLEGASKYGRYNWRAVGVRASVYHDALRRHLAAWWNGEDADPDTGVPHLASVVACAGILLDAGLVDKVTDDRPPGSPIGTWNRGAEEKLARIRELFKEHKPHQFTIADTR